MCKDDKEGPPCRDCIPEIVAANREVVKVWSETRTQVIMGANGPADINILAVKMIMDLYHVKDQLDCLDRVRIMYDEYVAARNEKYKREHPDEDG